MHTSMLITLSAALFVVCSARPSSDSTSVIDCDLGDPARLGACLSRLLTDAQPLVRWPWQLDPLRLPDRRDGELETWDGVLVDLSHCSVDSVSTMELGGSDVVVTAKLRWPEITGALSARLRRCKKVVFELCASASARPHLYIKDTMAEVKTILRVDSPAGGRPKIRATDTTVTLTPGSLKVKVNLRGLVGAVNNIIGDPASRIATKLTNEWWKDNSGLVEKKVTEVVRKLVENELTSDLEKLTTFTKE